MKVKDIIAKLQELDPTGEIEVTINNSTHILFNPLPAYYDGSVEEFIFESPEAIRNCSDLKIKAIKIKRSSQKINLVAYNISDYYWDNITNQESIKSLVPIDFSDHAECLKSRYEDLLKTISGEILRDN